MSTNFPTALDTLTNPTPTDYLNSPSHAGQHANANDAIEAIQAKVGIDGSAVTSSHDYKLSEVTGTDKAVGKTATQELSNKTLLDIILKGTFSGWVEAGETWTYAGADDPTYTFTISGDKTQKYQAGQKIKLTQSTGGTKYFIITKVAYSAPNTTITVYGGTDYDLNNEAISNPFYSTMKAPFGFPLSPLKWRVTGGSTGSKANPANGTWYNLGGNIVLPIGAWLLRTSTTLFVNGSSTDMVFHITLSTANNTQGDADLTIGKYAGTAVANMHGFLTVQKHVVVSAKTTYYRNCKYGRPGGTLLYDGIERQQLEAVCAYL